jgi:hypothetical protein
VPATLGADVYESFHNRRRNDRTIAIVDGGRIERMSMSNAHWGKAAVTQTSSDVAD